MALQDIIRKEVSIVDSKAEIKEAAKLMYKDHVGSVIVVNKSNGKAGIPIGVVTDRDIALAIGKNGELDLSSDISEIMSLGVIVCSPEDGISETISKMSKNGIRRVPVVDDQDQIMGVVEADDLYQLLGNEINELAQVINCELDRESNIERPTEKNKELESNMWRPRFF